MSVGTFAYRPAAARPLARPRMAGLEIGALVALTALAAALRFAYLGRQGFWFDEANTALLVHLSAGNMLGLIPHSESTPPLYYLIAWAWAHVFGYDEAALRSLSALAGVLVVPVTFALGRRLAGARVAVAAAALVATNPLLVWYSQEARSYELLVLLSALALLACVSACEQPTPRRLAAWVLAAALALATHYYAAVAIVPQALWLLAGGRHRDRRVLVAVGVVAACGLALIPLALSQNGTGHANWIAGAPLGRRVGQIVPQFLTGFALPAGAVLVPLAGALAVFGLALLAVRGEMVERRAGMAMAALALGGFVLALILVAGGFDDLLTRNLIALWLPAALVVAGGFAARRAGVVGALAALALSAIGVVGVVGVDTTRADQRPDWRGVARVLGPRPAAAAGARVLLIQHYRDLLPLSLYLPGLKFVRGHQAVRARELDVIAFSSPPSSGFCWWGSACNLWPSQLQSAYRVPGFHVAGVRHVYQFSVLRMVADRPQVLSVPRVRRALTSRSVRRRWELLVQG